MDLALLPSSGRFCYKENEKTAAEVNGVFSDVVDLHSDTRFLSHQKLVVMGRLGGSVG